MAAPQKGRVLPLSFFQADTLDVTEALLGKSLCRRLPDGKVLRLRVCEAEAYDGPEDKACHAARGMTPRNAVMFGSAGRWYVYLCYGVHWMLNIVTGEHGYPAAVLLRGAGEVIGPGRLTRALVVDKALDGQAARRTSGMWFEDDGFRVPSSQIIRTPRIGIAYAGEWVEVPYRFVWKHEQA